MTKQLIVTLGIQLTIQVACYVHFYLLAKRLAKQELKYANVTQILQAQCEQEDKIQLLAREIAGIKQELAKSQEKTCECKTKASSKAVAKAKATTSKATASTTKTTVKKTK
jgi:hypothetical protein